MILGLVQSLGDILQLIPKPVIGGATMLMFGSVAATGLAILGSLELNRRQLMIIGISLGLGLAQAWCLEPSMGCPPYLKPYSALLQQLQDSPRFYYTRCCQIV